MLNLIILRKLLCFFCYFFLPILTWANQPKWRFIFFSPERTYCTGPTKLPYKVMPFWNLHKKLQLPRTDVQWDLSKVQSWVILRGWGPLNYSAITTLWTQNLLPKMVQTGSPRSVLLSNSAGVTLDVYNTYMGRFPQDGNLPWQLSLFKKLWRLAVAKPDYLGNFDLLFLGYYVLWIQ